MFAYCHHDCEFEDIKKKIHFPTVLFFNKKLLLTDIYIHISS